MTDRYIELRELVDDLTLPKNVKVQTDHGITWAVEDALLVQLQEAISSTMNRAGGRGSSNSRMILDADALHRFSIIAAQIGDWCRMAGMVATRDPIPDLRAWAETREGKDNTFYIDQMNGWAALIRAKLSPRVNLEWKLPCPECDADEWVNEEGETVPHPILISYDPDNLQSTVKWECRREDCGAVGEGMMAQRMLAFNGETRQGEHATIHTGEVLP